MISEVADYQPYWNYENRDLYVINKLPSKWAQHGSENLNAGVIKEGYFKKMHPFKRQSRQEEVSKQLQQQRNSNPDETDHNVYSSTAQLYSQEKTDKSMVKMYNSLTTRLKQRFNQIHEQRQKSQRSDSTELNPYEDTEKKPQREPIETRQLRSKCMSLGDLGAFELPLEAQALELHQPDFHEELIPQPHLSEKDTELQFAESIHLLSSRNDQPMAPENSSINASVMADHRLRKKKAKAVKNKNRHFQIKAVKDDPVALPRLKTRSPSLFELKNIFTHIQPDPVKQNMNAYLLRPQIRKAAVNKTRDQLEIERLQRMMKLD